MLRKPGDSKTKSSSSRRRTTTSNETPDDKVRKLQRLKYNRNCADCSAKMPGAANLTHGTIVCLTCAGIHREFNHRIKGIGHSSFTGEEADFLSNNGNELINSKYMANYSNLGERLRPPNAIPGAVDSQLLRVWIRRKYLDKAWYADFGSGGSGRSGAAGAGAGAANEVVSSNSQGTTYQPTRVSIPSKKKKSSIAEEKVQQPEMDLLGGMWDDAPTTTTTTATATTTPAATVATVASSSNNNDAEWDAFGASRNNAGGGDNDPFATTSASVDNFQADFSQMQTQPPQQQPPSFSANFPPQQNLSTASTMNTQPSFDNNFPQQNQVQSMPSSTQPSFDANFQNQAQMQNMPSTQPSFDANFQQQNQMQNMSSAQQAFDAFGGNNNNNNNNMQMNVSADTAQPPSFNASFNQEQGQVQSMPSSQQPSFDANFNQQNQFENNVMSSASTPAQQQPSFNANFQQQQNQSQNMAPVQQQINGLNNNQQLMMPPNSPQMSPPQPPQQLDQLQGQQPSFNTNFDPSGSERPLSPPDMPPQPPQPSPNNQGQVNNMQFDMNAGASMQQQQDISSMSNNVGFQQQQQTQGMQGMPQLQIPTNMEMQVNNVQMNNNSMNLMQNETTMIPSPTSNTMNQNGFSSNPVPSTSNDDTVQDENQKPSLMGGISNANDAFDAFSSLSLMSDNKSNLKSNSVDNEEKKQSDNETMNTIKAQNGPMPVTEPMYKVGQKLFYTNSSGESSAVEVIKVHLDDELVPFYDIKMQDGREKQTDNAHLKESVDVDATVAAAAAAAVSATETGVKDVLNINDVPAKLASVANMMNGMNYEQLEKVEQFIKSLMMN